MTTQSYLFNQADDLKTSFSEEEWDKADLERLERQRLDPYGDRRAAQTHARDIDDVARQARYRGEGWAR